MVVSVAEVTPWGDFTAALVDSFEASSPELGEGKSGRIEATFLEAGEEGGFRVLVVNEDNSAVMVGRGGTEWTREEGLAAVDQVAVLVLLLVYWVGGFEEVRCSLPRGLSASRPVVAGMRVFAP